LIFKGLRTRRSKKSKNRCLTPIFSGFSGARNLSLNALAFVARPPRVVIPHIPHHITQRGNYRQKTFLADHDYQFYLDLAFDLAPLKGVSMVAYCLMPNHVHLIAVPAEEDSLSRWLQCLQAEYARSLHMRVQRVGHLWQARFYSVALDDRHLRVATEYVHQNPVRAKLVRDALDWPWSSARQIGADIGFRIKPAELRRMREGTVSGHPLGSAEFVESIRSFLPPEGIPKKRGRPLKACAAVA
jgi:REP element-mobilizing transposase RayT